MDRYVRVVNETRATVLAERCRVARSLRHRTVGLLATPEVAVGEGLWIERAPSIHMLFMRYPIDAVFVDRNKRVVRVAAHLRPWRIVPWVPGAADCIELRAGSAEAANTRAGDTLSTTDIRPDPPTAPQ